LQDKVDCQYFFVSVIPTTNQDSARNLRGKMWGK